MCLKPDLLQTSVEALYTTAAREEITANHLQPTENTQHFRTVITIDTSYSPQSTDNNFEMDCTSYVSSSLHFQIVYRYHVKKV
jgi:hypothetical protein